MEYISINGPTRLSGKVTVGGAKNAAVALLAVAITVDGVCIIDNLPQIEDVATMITAMRSLGVKCEYKDATTLIVDSTTLTGHVLDEKIATHMRASYYFMGALLGKMKKAQIPRPGGCDLGSRPIDYHLKGFEALGATTEEEHGHVILHADKLKGATIYLDNPSVGATINLMIAAVRAEGVTIIENAAKEPHVVDAANFLNKLGAKVNGAGTATIRINGVDKLTGCEYTVMPDPIEAGTYMIAAAITGGDVLIENIIPKHMESVTAKLKEMGCKITEDEDNDSIHIKAEENLRGIDVKTAFYPGFPTDLQPQMTTLMCRVAGQGVVTENVFDARFRYVRELTRLGAKINVTGRSAVTKGSNQLTGAEVKATDLRAGAALILAGLCAKGETIISDIYHLDRGYECFEEKFRQLGADIKRIKRDD